MARKQWTWMWSVLVEPACQGSSALDDDVRPQQQATHWQDDGRPTRVDLIAGGQWSVASTYAFRSNRPATVLDHWSVVGDPTSPGAFDVCNVAFDDPPK